ncbi:hypothetical protein GZH53_02985 [Flavihumibacter sp. R14]|nr:hypothetical protein [Flavihumibacter soli]
MRQKKYLRPVLILLIIFTSCSPVKNLKAPVVQFSPIKSTPLDNYNMEFARYCQADFNKNYETNAVTSNFFSEYKRAVELATLREDKLLRSDYELQIPDNQIPVFSDHFERILNDPLAKAEDKVKARKMLRLITPLDYKKTFTIAQSSDASRAIVESAGGFHFLLINEAHYSSQNRAFTSRLLKPLWDKGYRYLALEALEHADTTLLTRRYPLIKTGYYLRDPVFGNMVREAIQLGYKLIPYETKSSGQNSTLRDRDQALNIYNNTLKADPHGKVVIHAGYSHIAEEGSDSYTPMGAQLKVMAGQDILTIDQITMMERSDPLKLHPYFKYVTDSMKPKAEVVFKYNEDILVDPIKMTSIDMQVYHPLTSYIKGRPDWLLKTGAKLYDLPDEYRQYRGYLLQAFKYGEAESAVPVDQIIIDAEKALVLKPGNYVLKLTDRKGALAGTASLQINDQ